MIISSINNRIKEIRKNLGLTQPQFGEKLGLSRDSIANYESRATPSDSLCMLICKTFGVSEKWLIYGEGEMFNPVDLDVELAGYFGSVLADGKGSFQKDFLTALSKLPPEGWELLEEFVDNLIQARQKREEDGQ